MKLFKFFKRTKPVQVLLDAYRRDEIVIGDSFKQKIVQLEEEKRTLRRTIFQLNSRISQLENILKDINILSDSKKELKDKEELDFSFLKTM